MFEIHVRCTDYQNRLQFEWKLAPKINCWNGQKVDSSGTQNFYGAREQIENNILCFTKTECSDISHSVKTLVLPWYFVNTVFHENILCKPSLKWRCFLRATATIILVKRWIVKFNFSEAFLWYSGRADLTTISATLNKSTDRIVTWVRSLASTFSSKLIK